VSGITSHAAIVTDPPVTVRVANECSGTDVGPLIDSVGVGDGAGAGIGGDGAGA